MKKVHLFLVSILLMSFSFEAVSQVISESAKRKFTVGVDVFTDIWMYDINPLYMDQSFELRTIQQGATAFIQYNMPIGKQQLASFAVGLGIRNHNMYSNSVIEDVKADTIKFVGIPSGVDYRKSKLNLTYLDLPIEIKLRWKNGFKLVPGFKVGYRIDSKQKYKGDRFDEEVMVREKTKTIRQTEDWSYGFTMRIGYKVVSLYGYYQISNIFEKEKGPEMNPISVGITITPF
ncbi:MAG: PorT family protein [Bacteroidetes bacterium]|nr:PorT family protein [Bacteroidota bacterium]